MKFKSKDQYPLWTILLIVFCSINQIHTQDIERPFILVKASERQQVIEKIENKKWAKDIYDHLLKKTNPEVDLFYKNPEIYLKQLPLIETKPKKINSLHFMQQTMWKMAYTRI